MSVTPSGVPELRAQGRNARRIVHQLLRERIISLQLAPGQALSENDLARELGVSRTPVRESLILLADEGLVDVFPQAGTFVSRIREKDIAAAQFVREALERASVRDGGELVTGEDLRALRELLDAQSAADGREDQEEFFALDEAFHARLMHATGHQAAWPIVSQAKAQLDRARRLSLSLTQRLPALIGQHRDVLERLASGDVAAADLALRDHLRLVFSDVAVIRQQHPEMFDDGRPMPLRRRPRS